MTEPIAPYAPLNVLKPVADDVWIVDGPTVRLGYGGANLPFTTRMTVIRTSGGLFVHSPTELTAALKAAIDNLGPVAWIVGPNRLHYWWLQEWREAYPGAIAYLAPRLAKQAGGRIASGGRALDDDQGYPWDMQLRTLPIVGRYMTEVVFFHRASRTLLLTDLIENFEPRRLRSILLRGLTRLAGVQTPHGGMPRDLRLTFPRATLREAVDRMLSWDPERVIVAHGRWFAHDGAEHLRRAFGWLRCE